MSARTPRTEDPYGPAPVRDLLPGVAALYAAAADFEESYRYPSILPGAAMELLERLVASDPGARVARSFLEMLRKAAGVGRDHAGWPLDVLEAARALDLLLGRPEASVAETLDERELPWEYVIGLAEERIRRRAGDVEALRQVAKRLRPLREGTDRTAATPPGGERAPRARPGRR